MGNPWIRQCSLFSKIFNRLSLGWTLRIYLPNLKSVFLPVTEILVIEVLGGAANPQSSGREGRRGSEMEPFERALVSSYMHSVVAFPLSLNVSEILTFLCSSTPLFPTVELSELCHIIPRLPRAYLCVS